MHSLYTTTEQDMKDCIRKFIICISAAIFALSLGACSSKPADTIEDKKAETKEVSYYDIEFHRGGRDARPENTLYSFQYALENGASTIECDMQLTADGIIVLSHNSVLNPDITVDSKGQRIEANTHYIHDMTLEEIQSFNVGSIDESSEYFDMHGRTQVQHQASIPTLRQLFELVRDSGNKDVRLSIEAKYWADPAGGILYEKNYDKDLLLAEFKLLVDEFGFKDRVQLQSFDWDILTRMKSLDPNMKTVVLYSEQESWDGSDSTTLWLYKDEPSPWLGGLDIKDFDGNPVRAAASNGFDVVSPYFTELTKEKVEEAHRYGMKVIPWTLNSREDMEAMYEMGVDGMITDRPWILREFLESKGEQLPAPMETSLPYHLEPNHYEVEETKTEDGKDAAY